MIPDNTKRLTKCEENGNKKYFKVQVVAKRKVIVTYRWNKPFHQWEKADIANMRNQSQHGFL